MTSVLALDLAMVTGFAHSDGATGVVDLNPKRRGESPGMRYFEFRSWLLGFLQTHPAKIIAYEQTGHHRSRAATHVCEGLVSHVEAVAAELGIELTNRAPSTLKKRLFGKFDAKKQGKAKVMREVENRWPDVILATHDQADAIVLLWVVMEDLMITGTVWHGWYVGDGV